MPRYFFHVRQGDVLFRDPVGVELAGIEEAQSHAGRDIEILIGMDALDGPLEVFSMEVWDVNGQILSSPFQPARETGVLLRHVGPQDVGRAMSMISWGKTGRGTTQD